MPIVLLSRVVTLMDDQWRWAWVLGLASCLLNASLWIVVLLLFPERADTVVLHYSIGSGIDFVGQGAHITLLPVTGLILLVSNLIVGLAATSADRRVLWILLGVVPLVQLILLAAVIFLWHVNG